MGRWDGLCSGALLSCEQATTGMSRSRAMPFKERENSPISCTRLSDRPDAVDINWR